MTAVESNEVIKFFRFNRLLFSFKLGTPKVTNFIFCKSRPIHRCHLRLKRIMFENYTGKARRVILCARHEASRYGSKYILPEHLLLGLIHEDKPLPVRSAFSQIQFDPTSLRIAIEDRIVLTNEKLPQNVELSLTPESKRVLQYANEECKRLQDQFVGAEHILLGLLREEHSVAADILYQRGMQINEMREELIRQNTVNKNQPIDAPNLTEFCRDLTEAAYRRNELDPFIGRDAETRRIIQILSRRTKNNPLLIGEPGIGKTAIVEGLAQRIVNGEVPPTLENKRILSLDLSLIVAGTKYRGEFEERIKKILKELQDNPHCIIFIDEIHTLVGAGNAEGTLDAANILKPALTNGELQVIGATTPREFRKSIERDRALERRFQTVKVSPPSEDETLKILEGVREKYESFHGVRYTPEALKAAVVQTNRYLPDRYLPDKAIDVLDEAGACTKLNCLETEQANFPKVRASSGWHKKTEEDWMNYDPTRYEPSVSPLEVTKNDVEEVIARWTGIPISAVQEDEASKLGRIEKELTESIIGQQVAISALARAIRRSRAGLKNPRRPIGSFLFLGATGVGKTEVARSLAEFLFGSERAMIRLDMSEFMEKHTVAKLIGAPPGYVGHDEGGQLTEKLKRQPYSVVLLDEIEKAHPDLFNVLLQVFEDGILTDSQGNTADCRHAIFIMTSNIGARFIQKRAALGFQAGSDSNWEKIQDNVLSSVRQIFSPEFINRVDEIIVFDPLSEQNLLEIIDLQINKMNKTLEERGLQIYLTEEAKKWLVNETCGDRNYGARPLRRALQRHVEDLISSAILNGELKLPAVVEFFERNQELNFHVVFEKSSGS